MGSCGSVLYVKSGLLKSGNLGKETPVAMSNESESENAMRCGQVQGANASGKWKWKARCGGAETRAARSKVATVTEEGLGSPGLKNNNFYR